MVISKKIITKAGCVAIAASMVLSVAGCLGGKAKSEVIEAAESFAEAVKKGDPDKIIKLTTEKKDSEVAEGLKLLLAGDTDERSLFNEAVLKTFEAEVDESSVSVDGESAEADIIFSMVDYKTVIKDEYEDIDELISAIEDCDDTIEVTFSAEFEADDDEWLVSNIDDKSFGKVMDFASAELPIAASSNFVDFLDYTDWFFDDGDGVYSHYNSYIELDLWFTSDMYEVDPSASVYYEAYYEGSLVYTSDPVTVGGNSYIECIYGDSQGAELGDDGYMLPGEYEIIVYLEDGTVWTSDTCEVEEDTYASSTTTTSASSDIDNGDVGASGMFEFQDSDFEAKAIEAGWWDYEGTMVDDGVFASDTATIAFSIKVDPSETEEVYYAYYYSEDDDMTEEDMATPAYEATIAPTVYPNGDTYYDIDYTPSSMVPGYYLLIVTDANQETAYVFAACRVLDVTSAEY